jgi:hypothetical protein
VALTITHVPLKSRVVMDGGAAIADCLAAWLRWGSYTYRSLMPVDWIGHNDTIYLLKPGQSNSGVKTELNHAVTFPLPFRCAVRGAARGRNGVRSFLWKWKQSFPSV